MPRIVRPDPSGMIRTEVGSPLNRLLTSPLSETKNWQKLLAGDFWRQANHLVVFTSYMTKVLLGDCADKIIHRFRRLT
jgi:hypothetical protein